MRIQALGPIQIFHKRCGEQILPVGPVQQHEIPVPGCLRQHLARLALEGSIDENGRLHVVPVMRVVGGRLVVPQQFAGVGIQDPDLTLLVV